MKKRSVWLISLTGVLCVGIMLLVDGFWRPGYLIKSLVKILLFLLLPLVFARFMPELNIKQLFLPKKKGLGTAIGLGLGVYVLIVGGYFLLRPFVDFSGIAGNLSQNAGVTKDNFLLVSLYISFVNSLLEEFFFRGFCFWGLKNNAGRGFAYGFSALSFSVYHTAMMAGWFDCWLFALALLGLAVGGGIFNWLNEKHGNIYTSWLMHMFCNFAINTVGFILL